MDPLRGRDGECAGIDRLVTAVAKGASGIAIVEGAAGIGKSRLLAEAARIAAGRGVQVAAGASDELDQVTPWAPLLRALSSTAPALVTEADLAPARELADQRLAVIECVRAALERASQLRPLLITLDDLQWADPATLQALGSLPAQLFSFPVGWILARRPLPASAGLQSLNARLDEIGATRLHLDPLGADAAAAIAADVLPGRPGPAVAELLARAGGNPLYIAELLRGTAAGPAAKDTPASLPATLRAAVAAHMRSLPEPARDLLKIASVIGREFSVPDLAAMTGQPASRLLPSLEDALAAEAVSAREDRFAFRHDLFREAIYQDVPLPLRRALHRDAATALLGQGVPLPRVATHLALGARPGDEQAVSVLIRAIRELSPTSPSAAGDLGLRVLDLTGPGDPRRPGLVATTVSLLGWAARADEARALGQGYLRDHPQPAALEAEIQSGMRRAWARTTQGPFPEPLPGHLVSDPAVAARLRADLLAFEQIGALWDAPAEDVERELRTAAGLVADGGNSGGGNSGGGHEASRSLLASTRVVLAQEHGRLAEALEMIQPAGPTSPPAGARRDESIVASCLHATGRTAEALTLLGRCQRAAHASGDMWIVVHCQGTRALALLESGRLDDALAEAQAAARGIDDLGIENFRGRTVATLAEILIRRGDPAAATAAVGGLDSRGTSLVLADDHRWAAALCADARGKPRAALEALAPALRRLDDRRFTFAACVPSRLAQVTALAMRAGDPGQAGIAARAAAELARRNPDAAPVAGVAAHARGLAEPDAGALREAVELLSGAERPLAAAAAREDLGAAVAREGRKDDAVALLEAAYAAYLSAGAVRDLARARGALHALGVRKRQPGSARPGHGWASLTDGELTVVNVVAQGLTSREAAAQLYLSPDTVNTHLRHAFAKLGIRSRVELARLALSRQGTP